MIDFPATLHLFGRDILLHPITETLGIFLGMRYYYFLKRKSKSKNDLKTSLAVLLGATLGALIGSKIIGNLENPALLFSGNLTFQQFWTNNTIVGGLAFGLLGVELAKKVVGHKESTGDIMVFPLILAMIVGRIGCFFTGIYEQTYGIPTTFFLGMDLGDGLHRHPVALYEIGFLILLWIELNRFKKKWAYPSGFLFQLFMLSYFSFRFLLDFIKPRNEIFLNLGAIQITCMLMIFYYIYKVNSAKPFIKKRA